MAPGRITGGARGLAGYLGIRRRKSVLPPVLPHLLLLIGENPQIRARFPGTQQDESRLTILRKIADGICLIHFAALDQSARASETTSLMAERRQRDSGSQCRIPNMLVSPHDNRPFSFRRDQRHLIRWDLRVHLSRVNQEAGILKATHNLDAPA